MRARRSAAVAATTLALGFGFAGAAQAAPNNTNQEGLVNLSLTQTNIQVPIGIAANICGVAVNALSGPNVTFPVDCNAFGDAEATRNDGGANYTRQRGLVNIAVTDLNVQVPVGVAANICGVSANVISTAALTGPVDCDALGEGDANG